MTVRNVLLQNNASSTDRIENTESEPRRLSLTSRLQRRISTPVRRATQPPIQEKDPPEPSTQQPSLPQVQEAAPPQAPPPSYEDAVPAVKWLGLLRQRWKWKAAAIILSKFRDLFFARLVMRWTIAIGRYFLGRNPLWLSTSSLLLFWTMNFVLFRIIRLGRFSCLGALWSLSFMISGYSIWIGSLIDFLIFMASTWVGGQLDGRFLTAEESRELERLVVLEEFWLGVWRHLATKMGLPTNAIDQRLAALTDQLGAQ